MNDVYSSNGHTIYCRKNTLTDRFLESEMMMDFFSTEEKAKKALKDTTSDDFVERIFSVQDFYYKIPILSVIKIVADSPASGMFNMAETKSRLLMTTIEVIKVESHDLLNVLQTLRITGEQFEKSSLYKTLAGSTVDHGDLEYICQKLG